MRVLNRSSTALRAVCQLWRVACAHFGCMGPWMLDVLQSMRQFCIVKYCPMLLKLSMGEKPAYKCMSSELKSILLIKHFCLV